MLALRTAPVAIRLLLAALTLLLVVYAAELTFHFLPETASVLMQKYSGHPLFLGSAALCALRGIRNAEERAAWLLMGLGLLSWELGLVFYTFFQWNLETIPMPSPADAGYLLFYPPTYAALALLSRSRIRGRSNALWIDGAIGALAVGAVGAAILFDAVLQSTGGPAVTVATNLGYPLADLLMLALVVAVVGMTGWRKAGVWGWIAGGMATFAVADGLYLYGTAVGSYEAGVIYDAGWAMAALLVAYGAWTPATPMRVEVIITRRAILLPILFAVASIGLLVYDHFHRTNELALALAALCLLAVLARLAITYGDNLRMLSVSRVEASTDPLTGLRNRRSLTRDLDRIVADATAERPACLALYDLDGFKSYNDTFGHPAGDSLLTRLGSALDAAVEAHGRAYRIGGDEFCVLTDPGHPHPDDVLAEAAARAQRARRRLRDRLLLRAGDGARGGRERRAGPPPRGRAHVPAQERRPRLGGAPDPATCCCARWPSAIPRWATTCPASRSWPGRSASGSAWSRTPSRTCAARPSCTTSARWRSRTPSSTSPARWTRPSGSSCAATRSSGSASCRPRPPSSAWPTSCGRPTSGWTARAIPTSSRARRSRSRRGSCSSATPSRR